MTTLSTLPRPAAASPAARGFDPARLDRVRQRFEEEVAAQRLPGAVVSIAHRGQTVFEQAYGFQDREAGLPMRVDSVFRIASMTKPVTTVAALMLAEEGRLLLQDAVAKYLPEFAGMKVGMEGADGQVSLAEARQPMTIQDLMRHTSGLTYGLFGQSAIKTMYNEARAFSFSITNEEMVSRLARLPLTYQPGTTFDYGMSTDVLGRVVEVLSGQTLGAFFRERILEPLGMADTGFAVPHAGGRVAEPQKDPVTGSAVPMGNPLAPTVWESGGAGLASTAADYQRFCQMLLNEGEMDGVRYLAPSTVRLMASDHLPPGVMFDAATLPLLGAEAPMPAMGQGFGLGFAVRKEAGRNPMPGSVGTYFWGGAFGTFFWIDPQESLVAVLMTQAPTDRLRYRYLIQQLVYQAMV